MEWVDSSLPYTGPYIGGRTIVLWDGKSVLYQSLTFTERFGTWVPLIEKETVRKHILQT